jgi:hypothetical protein
MWQTRNGMQSTFRENMTTDRQKEKERIAALEAAEQSALLNQPLVDEDDESTLIIRVFPDAPKDQMYYIPGDPDFPGPPRSASK